MTVLSRTTTMLAGAGIVAAAWAYAQTAPADACTVEEVWMSGEPGAQATVTGLRIPPDARQDDGVTFCIHGVVVKAKEATMVERRGERTFTLSGTVTLVLPPR